MTCTYIPVPGGVAIVCRRDGGRSRAPCDFCRAKVHEVLCDFPLRGKRKGRTCSKRICPGCASHVGERDFCPPHAKMLRESGVDSALLGDPDECAMEVVADAVEQFSTPMFIPTSRADWHEFLTERAAIAEYVGGLSRADAEKQAREEAGSAPRK